MDALTHRIYTKALGNELAIAVGGALSNAECSLPALARALVDHFSLDITVETPDDFFYRWNDVVEAAEKVSSRASVSQFISDRTAGSQATPFQLAIARIPVSNFLDTTFDRTFTKALIAVNRRPVAHDWDSQMIGSWKQRNPDTPNIFYMLPRPDPQSVWFGVRHLTGEHGSIQVANISEMLDGRDLLLLDFSFSEADAILRLNALALSGEKIINLVSDPDVATEPWSSRGVIVGELDTVSLARQLTPKWLFGEPSDPVRYGPGNMLVPRGTLLDLSREKRYDAFMSYFSGDAAFAKRLELDLRLRDINIWRDEHEIEIGDSLSTKIQEGLEQSYSLLVVLSPEALTRPWVNEELRAAYARRLAGDFKIFPVVHKECPLPPFLADYRFADFRDENRYEESLALLERSIKNTVKRAREKK